jgi:hypothetical protein
MSRAAGVQDAACISWLTTELSITARAHLLISTGGIELLMECARFKLYPTPFTTDVLICVGLTEDLTQGLSSRGNGIYLR